MNTDIVHIKARVYGMVQGVGFRWSTIRRATALNLTGFVQNMPDGSVEVRAEGFRTDINQLVDWLRIGPSMSSVSEVQIEHLPEKGDYTSFDVKYR